MNCENKCNIRQKGLRSCEERGKIEAEGMSFLPGGFALEDAARVAIHPESDGVESCLRDAGEIRALGEEATDKAIGIFIATALSAIGMGDVMDGTRFVGEAGGRDSGRVSELAAIIGGNGGENRGEAFGAETSFEAIEQLNHALGCFSAETEDELETGRAFGKDEQGAFLWLSLAHLFRYSASRRRILLFTAFLRVFFRCPE